MLIYSLVSLQTSAIKFSLIQTSFCVNSIKRGFTCLTKPAFFALIKTPSVPEIFIPA